MANGLPLVDTHQQMRASSEFKAPTNNFTSFSGDMLRGAQATISRSPESGKVTKTEPPKYQEDPTVSMSAEDRALTDKLMAQIMEKPKSRTQEVIPPIEKNISEEKAKKPQGFWAQLKETIQNFFRNLFR